jgi:predicted GIY-YIG superfamily endonuclease
MSKTGYVYILASRKNGTLYTGVTSDLVKRIAQHKDGTFEGFTEDKNVKTLVYFEVLSAMPCLRQTSAVRIPASCSLIILMICSSENLVFFIVHLLVTDSTINWTYL